jgi:hypothetical protein
MRRWMILGLLLLVGAAPAAKPGEKTWELTPYLKGTAEQIRDLLNSDVDRLSEKQKELSAKINELGTDVGNEQRAAVARVRRSDVYAATAKAIKEGDAKLEGMPPDAPGRFGVANQVRRDRAKLKALEASASDGDEQITTDKNQLSEAKLQRERISESLTAATAWRAKLIDAVRFTYSMKGPLRVGSDGTLGKVTVVKISGPMSMIAKWTVHRIVERGDEAEAIEGVLVRSSEVNLLVSGVSTHDLKEGQTLFLDRHFVLSRISYADDLDFIFAVKPSPNDRDDLLTAIFDREHP